MSLQTEILEKVESLKDLGLAPKGHNVEWLVANLNKGIQLVPMATCSACHCYVYEEDVSDTTCIRCGGLNPVL